MFPDESAAERVLATAAPGVGRPCGCPEQRVYVPEEKQWVRLPDCLTKGDE